MSKSLSSTAVGNGPSNIWSQNKSVQQLIARMTKLPSVPVLYNELKVELAKPDASVECAARIVAKDPAMTAKVLRMVNSAAFGLASQILDPLEAVMYLGIEPTKALILAASLMSDFEHRVCPSFSQDQFWRHSLTVGAFARLITLREVRDFKVAEIAFTAGLLHDVGKLLLAANLPELYVQVLKQSSRATLTMAEVEKDILDATHGELAAYFFSNWGLPESILEAIAWHNFPGNSGDSKFSLLTAVHVANGIEHQTPSPEGAVISQVDLNYLERIGMKERCEFWLEVCGFIGGYKKTEG